MKRDYIEFQERNTPVGYLITFRCYGTWLHGDERGSVDRRYYNIYGMPKIESDPAKELTKLSLLKSEPFLLGPAERGVVDTAVREVCRFRDYPLHALNVRTNHAHVVSGNSGPPERMMNEFKAYATRGLRSAGLIGLDTKPWSRHGSTRYLWTEEHLTMAVDYVVNGQGEDLPKF